jgi:hypothetical protein
VAEAALSPEAWDEVLPSDYPRRDYILDGVRHGFKITDAGERVHPAETDNYSSATAPATRDKVEAQINSELANGHYRITTTKPIIVSALGAIPKRDSDRVRLIHDCSRPAGSAVNDYATTDGFHYQSIQDAVDIITPNAYMAKVDLSQAYRAVKIHPSDYCATGLKWKFAGDQDFTYMVDTRLPFGARKSPEIFNELSTAVREILARKWPRSCVNYLDDFLVVAETYEGCKQILAELLRILRKLGFWINYNKLDGPTHRLTFLGIVLDSTSMMLELPERKLRDFYDDIGTMYNRRKCTKKQLQSLVGKLMCVWWAISPAALDRLHQQTPGPLAPHTHHHRDES